MDDRAHQALTGRARVRYTPGMTREQIARQVDSVLADEFEIEADLITPDAQLFADLGLDSLDAVDLIVSLEATFGARVPEEAAKKVKSVADVYSLIEIHALGAS